MTLIFKVAALLWLGTTSMAAQDSISLSPYDSWRVNLGPFYLSTGTLHSIFSDRYGIFLHHGRVLNIRCDVNTKQCDGENSARPENLTPGYLERLRHFPRFSPSFNSGETVIEMIQKYTSIVAVDGVLSVQMIDCEQVVIDEHGFETENHCILVP